ncbi:MAG: carbon-nitrogen hydrolase family protein [Armatimonadetes bacterium]|nr:carbon-nitrogen hydrolase family protein [Armatimonadota bacterium]
MSLLKIALLQMASCRTDREANREKGERFCREAHRTGADIALFPEMWSNGYRFFDPALPGAREAWAAEAVGQEDPFILHFRELARELEMAIALTYLERWEGRPRNTVSLIDRRGEIRLTYAKVHTCEFDIEAHLTPGDGFPVCPLDTGQGEVKIGAMICYDREFPESARILMLAGAEIILVPNACGWEKHRRCQLRTRAYENMVGIAMTNYAAPDCNGHSVAYDAVAFGQDEKPLDLLIVEAGESEGVYMASFDLDRLRAYREHEAWGNAYRRPRLYGLLTSEQVDPPFVRPDATR